MTTPKKGDIIGWNDRTLLEDGFLVTDVHLNQQGFPVMLLQPLSRPDDPDWIQCWGLEGGHVVLKTFEERTAERLMA